MSFDHDSPALRACTEGSNNILADTKFSEQNSVILEGISWAEGEIDEQTGEMIILDDYPQIQFTLSTQRVELGSNQELSVSTDIEISPVVASYAQAFLDWSQERACQQLILENLLEADHGIWPFSWVLTSWGLSVNQIQQEHDEPIDSGADQKARDSTEFTREDFVDRVLRIVNRKLGEQELACGELMNTVFFVNNVGCTQEDQFGKSAARLTLASSGGDNDYLRKLLKPADYCQAPSHITLDQLKSAWLPVFLADSEDAINLWAKALVQAKNSGNTMLVLPESAKEQIQE